MRNKYIHALICTLIVSVATIAQSNKPTTVTHAAATQTPDDRPVYPSGIKVNYVRTKLAMAPNLTTEDFDLPVYTKVKESTQYIDGLGRPLQTVVRQITPGTSPKDIVNPIVYDEFGREINKYLPYIQDTGSFSNNGQFKTDPFNSQQHFYQFVYPSEQPFYTDEQFYYGKTDFENSPLNRPLKTMAPGNSWAGSNVGVSMEYRVNTIDDAVHIWNITSSTLVYDGDATINIPVSPTTGGIYEAGQLYKTITKDEQGNAVVEYKDKEGQTILKKVQSGAIATDYSGYTGFLCTYYIYDDLNQLRFVIPPKAVEWLVVNSWNFSNGNGITDVVPELCFRYEYDYRQRMIAKKVPGAGWVYMVYDIRDRLVFTQDANLRAWPKWMATLYDELNRPVLTGMINYSGNRDALQAYVNGVSQEAGTVPVNGSTPASSYVSLTLNSYTDGDWKATQSITLDNGFESSPQFSAEIGENGAPGSFTNSIPVMGNPLPPGNNLDPLILNFYDDYSWTDKTYTATYNSQLTAGQNLHAETLPTSANNQLKGIATGTKLRIIEGTDWLSTVNFYDDRNRMIQSRQTNMNGGDDVTANLYDFTGKVLSSLFVHNNPSAGIANLRVLTAMQYDHAGRIQNITKKINDGPIVTIEEDEYDMMGQLKTKKLGRKKDNNGNYTSTPLETLDYTYNIRGWLKGINKDYANNTGQSDRWFGMELNYDWGFDHNQLNGNIAGTKWRSKGDGEQRAYGFGYDKVNRLLSGDFSQKNGSSYTDNATINFDMQMGDGINATSAYDANGNILGMKQWGLKGTASQVIDDLSYQYMGANGYTNKLKTVTESASIADMDNKLGDFTDKNRTGDDYAYDANGNMWDDKNKKIHILHYNHLNLPDYITASPLVNDGFGNIQYLYDAAGNKLQKKITDASSGEGILSKTITNYISGFVYEGKGGLSDPESADIKLQFFSHEDGRVRYIAATDTKPEQWVYDYFIKDHLGNTRTVLTDEQQTDAYPAATMEIAQATTEEALYKNLSSTRDDKPDGYPTDTYTDPNDKVAKTNGSGNKIGPSIILKVMAGDKFSIRATSWYKLNGPLSSSVADPLSDIVSALISGVPAISGGHISTGDLTSTILNPNVNDYLSFRNIGGDFSTKPKAYVNAILLDDQFKAVNTDDNKNSWFDQVGEDQELKPHLLQEREITKNGYLYIYTSNETQNIDVFFDNLQVTHIRGPLVEETHYYPFGLTMSGISSKALKSGYAENKYKFNGIEQNNDFDINMYDAFYRNLDPQIGRFWQIDPRPNYAESPYAAMDNNPVFNIDPLGDTTINGQKYEPQTPENATALENLTITGYRLKPGIVIQTTTSCHISNQAVAISQEAWWSNVTKDLDKANGQVMPSRSPLIDFLLGKREIEDPDYSPDDIEDLFNTGMLEVGADGYIIGPSKNVLIGFPPDAAIKGVPIPSLTERASNLSKQLGKNSITIKTVDGHIRYDLVGRPHWTIKTPHSLRYTRNVGPNGLINFSHPKFPDPMTQQELRIIRNYIKSLGK